jgi:hypothetical protein
MPSVLVARLSEQRDGVRERREQHEDDEGERDQLLSIHTGFFVFGRE